MPTRWRRGRRRPPVSAGRGNPAWDGYFADPFVWRVGEEYFAIGTGAPEARAEAQAEVFPLLRSPDLAAWSPAGHALARPDEALGDAFWAPEIAFGPDGAWYLYYSVGHGEQRHHLRVARASAPLGPYEDVAALTSPDAVPFAIDPHPFCDRDGRWWLFHARDFIDLVDERGGEVRAGTALVVAELPSMSSLGAEVHVVARARCDWQRYARERCMYGAVHDWHTLEGPFVVEHGGRYWCLYSGGCWQDGSYGVDYVVADSPRGKWDDDGAEAGPRVLRSSAGRTIGPGHCSVVTGPDGATQWIAYHAWDAAMTARRMHLDPLVFTAHGPRVVDHPNSDATAASATAR